MSSARSAPAENPFTSTIEDTAAVVWDAEGAVVALADELTARGLELAGAKLIETGLSKDGSALLGQGYDADGKVRAFVARLAP